MSTIAERVAAGAAFLDEHDPDWWRADVERAIDLDKLNLASAEECVLGQRCPVEMLFCGDEDFPAYYAFGAHLAHTKPWKGITVDAWAIPLGFQNPRFAGGDEFDALTAEWVRVITGRRAAS